MARSLGDAFVRIRPDATRFPSELKSKVSKADAKVNVLARLDADKLKADLRDLSKTKANITADSADATAQIRALKRDLSGLNEKVKIEGNTAPLQAQIAKVKDELAGVSSKRVDLNVNTAVATAQIKRLKAQMIGLDDDKGGGGGLKEHLAGIAGGFADAGAAMGSIMTKAGMVGPALLSVGAAASAAASSGVALVGALGPAAAGGLAAYGGALLAVKQGTAVAQFAFQGMADAVGGDKKAMDALSPAGKRLANTLKDMKPQVDGVRQAAQAGLFPGVADAAQRLASNYFPLLRRAARQTGDSLGFIALRAGEVATSGPWKRDFATVTRTNAHNLGVLGTIGLSLADVFRNLLVTSLPLTTAFLRWGAGAARALQSVTQAGRDSGALAGFWAKAAAAGATFGRIVGNLGVALFNVFRIGSSPVGRNLLGVVESLTVRFREWTGSASGAKAIAAWFAQGRTNVAAMGKLVGAVFGGMKDMGSGAAFAPLVDQIRTQVLPPLMAFLHNASASGALQALVKAVGNILQVFAGLSASDQSLKAFAVTLGALARAAGWAVTNIPGASKALGAFFVLMGANQALKVVGLGGAVRELGGFMVSLATSTGRAAVAEKAHAFWTGVETVASKVAAGAAKAWAGAQWLLNAALTDNPIGLVVIAIAALVGGFILAYKKSETFRNIVNGAMNGVKNAASAVTGWFKRSFVPFFTTTIPNAFRTVVRWVRNNWPVILAIITGPIGLATLFISRHWDTITKAFRDAKNWAVGTFKRAWAAVSGVLSGPVHDGRVAIGNVLDKIHNILVGVKNFAVGAFKRDWAALKAVFTDPVQSARDVFNTLLGPRGPIRRAFSAAVRGIKAIWSDLKAAVKDPIGFIVNTVFNKGIVPFVNRIPFIPGTLRTIQGFDTGGYTGPGGKYEPAGIVHRDEHVWTKEESSRFPGGHRGLDRLRARTRMGLLREGEMAGYAEGGRVRMDGKLLSVIAARQIRLMEKMAGTNFYVMQGGYGGSHIAASGTSHNYSGVADISPASIQYERLARRVGFAAWARNIAGRSRVGSGAHIHAVSLLDPGDARSPQVYGSWRNHGNGLSGANNDPAPHVPWLPGLSKLLGNIPLVDLRGGGGPGGGGYGGPTVADARESLNPAKWVAALRRMGGWGRGLGGTVSGVVGNLRDVLVNKIKSAVAAAGQAVKSFAGEVIGANSAKSFAQKALGDYGWGIAQWPALNALWEKESGWDPRIRNRSSGAYGIPQALPGSKMASAGRDWRTNPATQIRWGLGYIKNTYGRPTNAWAHSQRVGWYDDGGVATGRGFLPKYTPLPERVLTARQTGLHDRQTVALEALAAGSGRRMAITITNWKTGEGYMSAIADDRVKAQRAHDGSLGRMRR